MRQDSAPSASTSTPAAYAAPAAAPALLAACLCAGWCRLCESYRATWEEAAAEWPGASFRWIDVEDQADLLGDLDIEDFPTLLIVRDGQPRFFGPALPHADTLRRLLRSAADGPPVVTEVAAAGLVEALIGAVPGGA